MITVIEYFLYTILAICFIYMALFLIGEMWKIVFARPADVSEWKKEFAISVVEWLRGDQE